MSRRVLVPVDLSERSAGALTGARSWLGEDIELWVVLVHDPSELRGDDSPDEAAVEAFAKAHGVSVHRVDVLESNGNVAIEIARHAQAIEADAVVVGSHGRTGLARVQVGSVAERVVRYCGCPVLVIKTGPTDS